MRDAIGPEKTREDLRKLHSLDPEARLLRNILRRLADPIKPLDDRGRFRPHPLLVWLLSLALVVVGVFVYFSYNLP